MFFRTSVLIFLVGLASTSAYPQTWTYQGNSSCFRNGENTQCFDSGTMQRYATSSEQFESAYRNGQQIGQGLAILIQAWAAHRRQLEIERKDIRAQISGYYEATFQLNDEISVYEKALISSYRKLANLDLPHRPMYEEAGRSAEVVSSRLAEMKPFTEKNLPGILAAKDMKYLSSNLELSQKFYNQALEVSKKQYVFSQLISGYVGLLEQGQNPSQPAQIANSARSGPSEGEIAALKSGAEGGRPAAQTALGKLYRDGAGVSQDYAASVKLFRSAANQGDAEAQLALGVLYEEGHGVIQDFVQAHMWYNLAAASGFPGAEARRNAISSKMTMDQISEAQKLAAQWRQGPSPK
jgi:TPR repeat protein